MARWNSRLDETRSANTNQFDLYIAIICMVYPGGVDVDLYDEYNCKDEMLNIIIQADE